MKPSDCYLDFWHVAPPKSAEFDIATPGGGRSRRKGYTIGEFGTHKEPGKGVYFWTLTHLPTGLSVTLSPPPDHKAEALMWLSLAAGGHLPDYVKEIIAKCSALGWGGK